MLVRHGSQAQATPWRPYDGEEVDIRSTLEIWDGEMSETIEFVVLCSAGHDAETGGTALQHSQLTLNMDDFRHDPERIQTFSRALKPLGRQPAYTPLGELSLTVVYSMDGT